MKRALSLIMAYALAACAYALEVGNLKTQAYTNPIGIDVETPSFSWMLAS